MGLKYKMNTSSQETFWLQQPLKVRLDSLTEEKSYDGFYAFKRVFDYAGPKVWGIQDNWWYRFNIVVRVVLPLGKALLSKLWNSCLSVSVKWKQNHCNVSFVSCNFWYLITLPSFWWFKSSLPWYFCAAFCTDLTLSHASTLSLTVWITVVLYSICHIIVKISHSLRKLHLNLSCVVELAALEIQKTSKGKAAVIDIFILDILPMLFLCWTMNVKRFTHNDDPVYQWALQVLSSMDEVLLGTKQPTVKVCH